MNFHQSPNIHQMPGWSRQACPWVLITELPGVSSHTLPCSVGGWMAPRAPCALPSPSHPLPSTCQRDRLPEAPGQVRSFQSLETVHSSQKTMQTSGPCRTGPTSLPDAIHVIRGLPSASLPRGCPSGHACTRPCPEAVLGTGGRAQRGHFSRARQPHTLPPLQALGSCPPSTRCAL